MYVKLTKKDGSPIWINASYIVTIEPARQNGSVVVPIGDGLDYDVRESPERILRLIEGAPAPTVVPVPPPRGLAPTRPEDLSGDEERGNGPVENSPAAKAAALVEQTAPQPADGVASAAPEQPAAEPDATGPSAVSEASAVSEPAPASEPGSPVISVSPLEPAAEEEVPKKKRTTRRTKKTTEDGSGPEKKPAKPRTRKAKAVKPDFPDEQVEKLRRMAPGSVHKLRNTLKSQFRLEDPEPVIQMLVDEKVIALDQDHVMWA